ncbi:MAG: glycosyltransferase family 2 protein [Bacteroidales bacterium]
MEELVSVIIPCYNQGEYLHEALESVYQQTYKNIEIVVVNDGSTDEKTLQILNTLTDEKVTVLHKTNGHLSSARNYGIARCRGNYYVALDADDKLHPTFIERTLKILLEHPSVAVASSWAQYFGAKMDVKMVAGGTLENFLRYNNCTACATVRKKVWEEVGGYDENMKAGFEDWEFYINIAKRGHNILVITEPLFYYRFKKKSMITETISKRPEIYLYIINKHKDVYDRYYPQIIYELEKELQQTTQTFLNSTTYRLGNMLLDPFRKILSFIKSLFR